MYGQEIFQQKNSMKRWECKQKKNRWNIFYKLQKKALINQNITNKVGAGFSYPVPTLFQFVIFPAVRFENLSL